MTNKEYEKAHDIKKRLQSIKKQIDVLDNNYNRVFLTASKVEKTTVFKGFSESTTIPRRIEVTCDLDDDVVELVKSFLKEKVKELEKEFNNI